MNLYISLINYNSLLATKKCLDSIQNLKLNKDVSLFVYLLDNASDEFELKEQEYSLNLEVIKSEKNLGFASGHNLIIKKILNKADYILVLNNDTILESSSINYLLSSFQNEDTGIASPKIYFSEGSEFHKSRYQKNQLGKVIWYAGGIMNWNTVMGEHRGVDEVDIDQYSGGETDFASGCCMLIKKSALKRVGLFDEKYFLYYEDTDLSMRFKNLGYKIIFVPRAIIWHSNASSSGGSGSSLQDYYITRNRLLFGIKFAPIKSKLFLIKEGISLIISGRKWQRVGAIDFFIRKFGKGSYS